MPSPIDYLISAQHESGGWGYLTGQKPVVEPTAAVLLAIRNDPQANNSFERGLSWLVNCQHQDGGWGIHEHDPESGWQTAWALITLRYSGQKKDSMSRAEQWLTTVGTSDITQEEFQKAEVPQSNNIGALIWPWMPGQVGWIEPTAMAVIALGGITSSPLAEVRINAAHSYFLHNRTPDGGWDIGNAGPLDTIVLPRVFPTSLVLMALALIAPEDIQTIDLSALLQDLQRDPGMLAQSSGLLAMRTLGERDEGVISNLNQSQLMNGSWNDNPFFTAWAIMALRGYL